MENCGFMSVFIHVSPDCNLLFQIVGKRAKSGGFRPSFSSSCFEEQLWRCKILASFATTSPVDSALPATRSSQVLEYLVQKP